ncbi:MAG: VOC family protein [Chloroflexi bacterium]|nr:VOC family protein [Chloroflexota bacterium]
MANLYQVILLAWDVKRVAEFYRDIVGLNVTYPAPDSDLENENWVALDAGSSTLAIHGGGDIRGSGSVLLSFKVDDLEFTYWDLKKRGVEIQRPREVSPGVRAAKARDPEGNTLSFEQVTAR